MKFFGLLFFTFLTGILSGFYFTFSWNKKYPNHEEFVQKYLQSVEETFELHTLKVTGLAELHYVEKENHFLSYFTNPLFSKEYWFYVPFKAEYGINLKKAHFLKFYQSKIYVDLPPIELLSFDLQLPEKKIISKEGWLVFQDDEKFLAFEKKLYEKQKKKLIHNKDFKEKAQKKAQEEILELLKPLNLPVEFTPIFIR